ncbi:MAG: hypothetical protein A3C53_02190 [Omnitrophica WOR_2 bacterium RIFCSPHIGHO2_02_FULL_68_15]|nr:MAG: hypothetical protein A3C53_02190 [Omnitrophica WOR_2 bacterium RIFCSPHIGHO2_02_FULL_68_15]
MTLLELLVTVVVIGIVAAVAMPLFARSMEREKGLYAEATLWAIFNAERAYFFDQIPNNYGTLTNLQSSRYLSGNLNTTEWSYAVIRTGSPATAYSATATRLTGQYTNYRRRMTEASATQIDTLPPTGDTVLSQSWPP